MTQIAKDVLERYQVRKSKKQKDAFIAYVRELAEQRGYDLKIEKGSFGARNIVIGDPERAKVLYTAHYDTCAWLPFPNFITPKSPLIWILYQLVTTLLFIVLPVFLLFFAGLFLYAGIGALLSFLLPIDGDVWSAVGGELVAPILFLVLGFGALALMIAGPANKHTANDNTSGTVLLLEILDALPKEQRDKVCLVFFDLEEAGLFGSASFAKTHKSVMKNTLLLNFDCVSDGDHLLFVAGKGAREDCALIASAFEGSDEKTVEVLSKGAVYPSDQVNFKRGVGVSSLKRSKKFGLLYMDRIHTAKDVVFMEENIALLKAGALKLPELMV